VSGRATALLTVEDLCVFLGAMRHPAVDHASFDLRAGERLCLLGPSGCGKTTLLRAIAGFQRVGGGSITLDGRRLSDTRVHVPAHERGVGIVFQDFALFPHLSIADNVGFGLARLTPTERRTRTAALLELVGLEGHDKRLPSELSGGQEQRVALARALAPSPRLILLDEPFSSLDTDLRAAMREHAVRVLAASGAAALLVTHDQSEALSFAERLIVLRDGHVEQVGSPEVLYRAPRNAFVARALGGVNLVVGEAHGEFARTAFGSVPLQSPAHGVVSLCIRPETLRITRSDAPGQLAEFRGDVTQRVFQGPTCAYRIQGSGFELSVSAPGDTTYAVGETVSLSVTSPAAVLPE
jgi:iron(III) transport system ATP-binding protein